MKKIISLSLILVVLLCGCGQEATTKISVIPTSTTTDVVNTGTNSFSVDERLDFGQTIPVNTIYSKQVIVNINNTGNNAISGIRLETSGLDSNWICVGSSNVSLNSGDAVPYVITLSSKEPIASNVILNFTITLTAKAGIDVQHILTCYGEIVVSK
jgi:hypothetical protein